MRIVSFSRLKPKPLAREDRDLPADAVGRDAWDGLMAAAQDGHGGAYQRLLGEICAWLSGYFQRRLPPGDIDDAVQDTLLAVHWRRHTYDPRLPLRPWLAAIAKRKWIDQLRAQGRRPTDELPDSLSVDGHETLVTSATVLARLLDELRPAQMQVIRLVKLEGYSIEEAARETGLSPSAVKMNIHRGLARLTTLIEKTHDVE